FEPPIQEALAGRTVEERRALAADDPIREMPVDQSDAELERAAPIRALEVRALVDPAVDETPDAGEITAVAAEAVGLCEPDDLEMPVELPYVLRIADDARVAVIERLAEYERDLGPGQRARKSVGEGRGDGGRGGGS